MEPTASRPEARPEPPERAPDLLEVLEVLRRRRAVVAWPVIAGVALALLHGLLSPPVYESTATIIAPKESSGGGLASTLIASGVMPAVPSMMPPSLAANRDLFVNVLKSRTMAEEVVNRFDLKERYGERYLSRAIEELQEATSISASKQGMITVRAADSDPALAAEIANHYIASLDHMLAGFKTTEAGRQRSFIEGRLIETEKDLRRAEEELRKFQETHRAISLQEQTRTSVEAAARLKGQIIASQVQLEVMRAYATEENPEVVGLKKRIDESKRQLAEMQYGEGWKLPAEGDGPRNPLHEIHVPFSEFPELGLQLARMMRDLKVQETVYILLTQQLEEAKITEARDVPTVQVLDRAVPAERRSGPRVLLHVPLAAATGVLLGIFAAFFLEYLAALRKRAARRREAELGAAPSRVPAAAAAPPRGAPPAASPPSVTPPGREGIPKGIAVGLRTVEPGKGRRPAVP